MVVISDSTVLNSVAGSSGGGVAVRAVNLVDDVGTRTVAVTDSQLLGNRAHRGGGLFSEVDTVVTSTAFASNTAEEAGGGAAFKPSPCLTAAVVVSGSTFDGNAGITFVICATGPCCLLGLLWVPCKSFPSL